MGPRQARNLVFSVLTYFKQEAGYSGPLHSVVRSKEWGHAYSVGLWTVRFKRKIL